MITIPKEFLEIEKKASILFTDYHEMLLEVGFYNLIEHSENNKKSIILHHPEGFLVMIDNYEEKLNSKNIYYNILIDYDKNFSEVYKEFYTMKDSGTYCSYGDGRYVKIGRNSSPFKSISEHFNNLVVLKDWIKPPLFLPTKFYSTTKNEKEVADLDYFTFLNDLPIETKNILEGKIIPEHFIHKDDYDYNKVCGETVYEKKEVEIWNKLIEKNHLSKDSLPNKNSLDFYQKAKNLLLFQTPFDKESVICEEGINLFHFLVHIKEDVIFNEIFSFKDKNNYQENLFLLNSYDENGISPILHAIRMCNIKVDHETRKNLEIFLNWAFDTYKHDLILFNDKNSLINVLFETCSDDKFIYTLFEKHNINVKLPFHEVDTPNFPSHIINTFDFDLEKISKVFNSPFSKATMHHFENLLIALEKKYLENQISSSPEKSNNKLKI